MSPVNPIPELSNRRDVANLAGVRLDQLTWWIWAFPTEKRYDCFEIGRHGGKRPRVIRAPIKPIKDIQRNLAQALSAAYEPPSHVHGFTAGRSPKSNAKVHLRQRWVLRVDLKDFFPSINFGRVRGLFMAYPFEYPAAVATILAQICCFDNELPQGAPTSPIVSNYLCRGMDTQLARLAADERCYYSRYADDLCFSTDRTTFPSVLATESQSVTIAGESLKQRIAENGFRLNPEKTRLMAASQRQRVTGLVVNGKANIPRDYVRGLQALIYVWSRYGKAEAAAALARASGPTNRPPQKPVPEFEQIVRGRVQYVGSIKGWDDPTYQRLAARLKEIDGRFKPTTPTLGAEEQVKLYTEGESDLNHIRAAQEYFHDRGEFTDFTLVTGDNSARGSDTKLAKHCESLADSERDHLCVCLFDTDTDAARTAVGSDGWKHYGNGVIAVGLVPPPWRDSEQPTCIELLHTDAVLKTKDAAGRRVFQTAEFDRQSGHHVSESCSVRFAAGKRLIEEEVHEFESNRSLGRTKMDFAIAIEKEPASFDDLDFEGFRPTFQRIETALVSVRNDM